MVYVVVNGIRYDLLYVNLHRPIGVIHVLR